MALKILIMYNQGNRGWSETYYMSTGSVTSVDFSLPPLTTFLQASLSMRAAGVYIYGARVSFIGKPQAATLWLFQQKWVAQGGTSVNPPDVPSTDALIYRYDANGAKYPLYLRGLADLDVVELPGAIPAPTPRLLKQLANFIQAMQGASLFVSVGGRAGAAGITPNNVTQVEKDPANANWSQIKLQNVPAGVITVGSYVKFHGIDRDKVPGFPLTAVAQAVDAVGQTISIPYVFRAATLTYQPVKATVITQATTYLPVNTWTFKSFSERKTGRPFGSLRGRARSVVRAQ